jgi:type IV fimbrial biogenesis protein FimT
MKNNITGFTLIELMMVVAIISITMSIGLPSFQGLISNSRVTSTANSMLGAYQLARSEAIRRRASVSVKSSDNWQTWQVSYIDTSVSP